MIQLLIVGPEIVRGSPQIPRLQSSKSISRTRTRCFVSNFAVAVDMTPVQNSPAAPAGNSAAVRRPACPSRNHGPRPPNVGVAGRARTTGMGPGTAILHARRLNCLLVTPVSDL